MASPKRKLVYLVPPAVHAPIIVSGVVLGWPLIGSAWGLVALPFVWLGAFGAAPNLNLAKGFLAYTSMFVGIITSKVHEPLGSAIFFGAASGYYTAVLEQRLCMGPLTEDD